MVSQCLDFFHSDDFLPLAIGVGGFVLLVVLLLCWQDLARRFKGGQG